MSVRRREKEMTLTELVVIHCAPTVKDVKCSSLVCLASLESFDVKELISLERKGLSSRFLTNRKGCPLLFLYRSRRLEEVIGGEASPVLTSLGYDTSSVERSLDRLEERMMEDDFPHEIGIFLGYPLDDVKSFVENRGENFILSGVWKVYHNPEKAKRTFRLYSECTKCLISEYEKEKELYRLCV